MDCNLPGSCPWDSPGKKRSRLPCPPQAGCPNPGIKSPSPVSPALQADLLPMEPPGKPYPYIYIYLSVYLSISMSIYIFWDLISIFYLYVLLFKRFTTLLAFKLNGYFVKINLAFQSFFIFMNCSFCHAISLLHGHNTFSYFCNN